MPGGKANRPTWVRYSGLGFEFVAAVGVFAAIGHYAIDVEFNTAPWGLIVCVMLGIVGGMYNLIRQSMAAFKEMDRKDPKP
jgi:F0F1-type ATP synthase assembly protein I